MDYVLFKVSAEELIQAAGEGRDYGALLLDHCFDGQRKEFTVLVTGKAGDGKSTLVSMRCSVMMRVILHLILSHACLSLAH